jgi:AAA15 family ATPase/GTPase
VEIFSEMIGAEAAVCFIDEIESGIHHSCLVDVWTGIAEAARTFNVQVFATTHSHECIEAAHEAFSQRPPYDLGIIQLFREAGDIQGRVLDQQHIAAGISGDIDLRG